MIEGHERGDFFPYKGIYQPVVIIDPLLVDCCIGAVRHDSRPGDRETVRFHLNVQINGTIQIIRRCGYERQGTPCFWKTTEISTVFLKKQIKKKFIVFPNTAEENSVFFLEKPRKKTFFQPFKPAPS